MQHHLAGATIQDANSVNYNCHSQDDGNKRMALISRKRITKNLIRLRVCAADLCLCCLHSTKLWFLALIPNYYPTTKSECSLASSMCPSAACQSARSFQNHISLFNGQILPFFGANYMINIINSRQKLLFNTSANKNRQLKRLLTIGHCCPVPVDKRNSIKVWITPLNPYAGSKVK